MHLKRTSHCMSVCATVLNAIIDHATSLQSIAELISGLGDLGLIPQLRLNGSSDSSAAYGTTATVGSDDTARAGAAGTSLPVGTSGTSLPMGTGMGTNGIHRLRSSTSSWLGGRRLMTAQLKPQAGEGASRHQQINDGAVGSEAASPSPIHPFPIQASSSQASSSLTQLLAAAIPMVLQSLGGGATAMPVGGVSFSLQAGPAGAVNAAQH